MLTRPNKSNTADRYAPADFFVSVQKKTKMEYSIDEHKHRFAAWAAGRAASVIGCRFPVEEGKAILEKAEMNRLICSPDNLPLPQDIDTAHLEWRRKVMEAATDFPFTHGIAAKLINIYFKAAFVCGGYHNHERVRAIHPPIDSQLLEELSKRNIGGRKKIWDEARKIRWSNFTSEQYEKVIHNIRASMEGAALWEVEKYWKGYQ
jgi:hypothetical protein